MINICKYIFCYSHYNYLIRYPLIISFSKSMFEILLVKYFSDISEAIGAAHLEPYPPFSIYTAIAISGFFGI